MSHKIALNLLDFGGHQSVTVPIMEDKMTKPELTGAVAACLDEMHTRLSEATRIAKAAQACAQAGSLSEAVTLSMDIEQLIYEAGRLHDAASLLNRISEN
jgi:hypothetical protein